VSDRAIQDVLTGTWGAVSCALREDWEGFDLLLNECVWSDERSANWSMAAVGGTAALLKTLRMEREDLLGIAEKYFSRAVFLAVSGESESVVDTLMEDIELYGTGVVVGQAVGQLGMAVELLAESFKLDREPFLRRLCLSVAFITEAGPTL
jgi:hypothetical protein